MLLSNAIWPGVPALPGWSIRRRTEDAREGIRSRIVSAPADTPVVRWIETTVQASLRLSFEGEAEFEILLQDRTIVYDLVGSASTDTIRSLLYEQVVPRLLAHCGSFILHASLVDVEGQTVALIGPSGRGKSTLGAAFHRLGFKLLGDDAAELELDKDGVTARSLTQSLRLYPDSIAKIFGADQAAVDVRSSGKKSIDLRSEGECVPRPLGAVFFLEPDPELGEVRLAEKKRSDTCISLIENSFSLDPQDRERGRAKLAMASALASRVGAYGLSYPREFAVLPDACAVVLRTMGVSVGTAGADTAQ